MTNVEEDLLLRETGMILFKHDLLKSSQVFATQKQTGHFFLVTGTDDGMLSLSEAETVKYERFQDTLCDNVKI